MGPPPVEAHVAAPPEITAATLEGLISFYRSQREEYDYWLSEDLVEGTVPAELQGTLYRNGPGQLEIFGARIDQPFDGDGMVCRFSFADGKAHFSNRYVRTREFQEEQEAGKILYAGAFASGNPSGQLLNNPFTFQVKNVANTGILEWAGRLFALHESGLPHEMDPRDLSTIGESNVDGTIEGKGPFAAHYRIMHQPDGTQRWVTFGSKVSSLDAVVSFYEYGQDGRLLHKTPLNIKNGAFGFFHDLAVTEKYYVLLQNPTRLNFRKLLFEYVPGRCSIAECIQYDDSLPTRVHLVPRPGSGATAKVFETEPFFTFHHVNAFEQGSQIILDTIGWKTISFASNIDSLGPNYYNGGQRSELTRVVIDTAAGSVSRARLSTRCCEFSTLNPAVNGRPYRHAYVPASAVDDLVRWGPNQVLMKVTLPDASHGTGVGAGLETQLKTELWAPGPMCFAQEPLFVPRRGATAEDDGWILMLVNNAESQRTDLCILDAQKIAEGPVCTLHLPHHIPPGLHGSWTDSLHVQPPAAMPQHWQPTFSTIRH